ncbi:ArnT family glycosyltransferase [Alloacidobacterium sp.]|uniref:ArnT family glycosyltransferase n=1 Tax=Alloacidobacterium sp. TaxID=2951999 RepID=UPI002D5CDF0D|nr:glycosyltransferase family 39 protein [Alloacidobacterium sp.]HYK34847.1 glycosyltransferase family 39 protein [Alloacidobacterium sp.]
MKWTRAWTALWITGICLLYGVHLLHLRADFPNFSPWMDYSKYTDEGWYGSAAVRHFLSGSWRVPGDFNPGAALPVWPVLEGITFSFTGVSLAAARVLALAVFGGNLLLLYALTRTQQEQPIAFIGVSIAASSAFLYAFSRLAILEPLLIFWMLLSWVLVLYLAKNSSPKLQCALPAAIGFLICLQVLTKTTAIFLIPSTAYLLWHAARFKLKGFSKYAAIAAMAAIIPWSAYYFLAVRPHFLADYHYLFDANKWEQPTTMSGWIATFWYSIHGVLWIDKALGLLALVLLVLSVASLRRLWSNPLFVASFLAAAGYIFFIGWHNNMQPRYYEVVAFPLIIIVCIGTATLLEQRRWMGIAALAAIAISIGLNLRLTAHFIRHTDHTFVVAAKRLTRYIDRHPNGNRLLLSVSGANITLITHLPSICDDFGTYDLPYRIHTYRPGWYAAWNEIDPETLEDLHTQYHLQRVTSFHAFDDEDRDVLVLYKLIPLPSERQRYNTALEEEENAGK